MSSGSRYTYNSNCDSALWLLQCLYRYYYSPRELTVLVSTTSTDGSEILVPTTRANGSKTLVLATRAGDSDMIPGGTDSGTGSAGTVSLDSGTRPAC